MYKNRFDLRCYVVTGAGSVEEIVHTASQAALGGAGVIQVRSKPISPEAMRELAAKVAVEVARCNPKTRVLIDDHLDVAISLMREGLPIHGVHLGQDDVSVFQARELLGSDAIIGLTTGTAELVTAANEAAHVLDYIGAGPFRKTPTKDSGRPPIGLDGYPPLVKLSALPVVAIGDVTPDDVRDLSATGVAGVAMVRAFSQSDNPQKVAHEVLENFEAGRAL
ncbi:thiamine-phosphate pyrophosphorylase [Corynebacterium suranareeae]|uniref:Thiamine-phosphate synthase n=1 Tax=Corynebacterium suranareeae TaxID=2506452 RepID=A0A161J8J0_9CORY|nr:thiamine phosphate synthase [Corynebacterium suranareeae]BAU96372.1 thiamine-phosphate pyrophosphorylase [Corynebacterium suranareeae]